MPKPTKHEDYKGSGCAATFIHLVIVLLVAMYIIGCIQGNDQFIK